MKESLNVVIVGRPNVGKSTLFNRLIEKRKSIVHNKPGITRDRVEAQVQWWVQGKSYPIIVVDTGGLGSEKFSDEISRQVQIALKEADVVLFLFDSQSGLTPLDEELLLHLKRSGTFETAHFIGVVNKVDHEIHEERVSDFFTFGLNPVLTVSAEQGRGVEDLRNAVIEASKLFWETGGKALDAFLEIENFSESSQAQNFIPRIVILGRPNVGKSTLINAILKKERMITSPVAGTTVDSIDSLVELDNKPFLFVDTAGIRRKGKTKQGIEVLSVVQTKKTLDKANLAILVLDGEVGTSDQDEKLGGLIEEAGCAVVLLVNKWDTQQKNIHFTRELAAKKIRDKMAFLKYAPIVFASALKGDGLNHLGELLEEILHQRKLKIPTHELTEWVRQKMTDNNPKNAKCYLAHQSGRSPPTFVCHVNDPDKIHFSLRRHIINSLRERWGFMGNPVKMLFIEGKNRRSLPKKMKSTK